MDRSQRQKVENIDSSFQITDKHLHFFPTCRSSSPEVFCENGVLRHFAKFTGKHLCQSLFFNKVAGHKCFPENFSKFLRTPFFYRTPLVAASEHVKPFSHVYGLPLLLEVCWYILFFQQKALCLCDVSWFDLVHSSWNRSGLKKMRKEGKTLLFLNLLVLFCVHQSKISIIVVQMRQKRIKLERINDDFLQKKARTSSTFLK